MNTRTCIWNGRFQVWCQLHSLPMSFSRVLCIHGAKLFSYSMWDEWSGSSQFSQFISSMQIILPGSMLVSKWKTAKTCWIFTRSYHKFLNTSELKFDNSISSVKFSHFSLVAKCNSAVLYSSWARVMRNIITFCTRGGIISPYIHLWYVLGSIVALLMAIMLL